MSEISDVLFRSLGSHALKELCFSEGSLKIVVAPWSDIANEATALFKNVDMSYIEAERDDKDVFLDFNFPWDVIRLDSGPKQRDTYEFGLCCRDVKIGFRANWPDICFV